MLKVLLVDDEPFILQGLSALIDWKEYGFQIVGTAVNGLEALEFLKKEKADLILADIRMPGMSGLELLEKVRGSRVTDAYFAIISGYSDFEYARTALQHACVDYILKPVGKEELIGLLSRVEKMNREVTIKKQKESREEKAYFSNNLIAVIYGKYDSQNLDYVKKRMKLDGGIRYISIEPDGRNSAASYMTEAEKRRQQRMLYDICLDILEDDGYHCLFDVPGQGKNYDIGFIYCDQLARESKMEEQEYLDRFLEKIRRVMGIPVVMFAGNRVDDITGVGESFRTAMVAQSFRDFRLNKETAELWKQAGDGNKEKPWKQMMDELIDAIAHNDETRIIGCTVKVYDGINGGMDARFVKMIINYFLFCLVHLAAELDENINQEEIFRFISDNAFEEGTIKGSRSHFIQFAGEYARYLAQLRSRSARGVLAEIEREVRDNYSNNLTLKELSQKYFINSAYLGQIFRKQYGLSFKDYLNNYRMERASELLLHTDLRIYEIAERVGYHDLDYFINKFIAAKGCTPTKFRKQMRK